jgi:hypothetical protein
VPEPLQPAPADVLGLPASGLGYLVSPAFGQLAARTDFRAAWFPNEEVRGQGTQLGYTQFDASLLLPLYAGATDEWSVSTHVRAEFFDTGAILPNTLQPFPDELWNVRFATSYRHLFENNWIAGGSVSFGSASDKPFNSIHELTAGVNAFLRIPSCEHNAWLFTLSYSANSELPFPIPGVAYLWQPSDNFRMNIGLPFALMWRPMENVTLDFSYMLLRTIHARATYRICPPFRVYIGFDWANEVYFLADRPDENDRFFYYYKRVSAGVLYRLGHNASLDFSSGFDFDRYYFESQHSTSGSGFNRVDVGNGPFIAVRFQLRF